MKRIDKVEDFTSCSSVGSGNVDKAIEMFTKCKENNWLGGRIMFQDEFGVKSYHSGFAYRLKNAGFVVKSIVRDTEFKGKSAQYCGIEYLNPDYNKPEILEKLIEKKLAQHAKLKSEIKEYSARKDAKKETLTVMENLTLMKQAEIEELQKNLETVIA